MVLIARRWGGGRGGRRGSLALVLLLLLPLLLLAFALAYRAAELNEEKTELRTCADAAALAAAGCLADDRNLRGDRDGLRELADDARGEARRYAFGNHVLGRPPCLDLNEHDDPHGDFVLSAFRPDGGLAPWRDDDDSPRRLDAVRVCVRADDGAAHALAVLDRRVVGLRPHGRQLVPLAPVGLLSDRGGERPDTWEGQVEKGRGKGRWHYDRDQGRVVAGGDGLREMEVRLAPWRPSGDPKKGEDGNKGKDKEGEHEGQGKGEEGGQKGQGKDGGKGPKADRGGNACLLRLGSEDFGAMMAQLRCGVGRLDLGDFGGEFLPRRGDGSLRVDGSPWGPAAGSDAAGRLAACLEELRARGEARVWPLYAGFDGGKARVCGLVAARVAHVENRKGGEGVTFVLKPCLLAVPSAVTDDRGEANRYLGKVRLAE